MSDIEKRAAKRPLPISAEEFDRRAENGEDLDEYFDWDKGVLVAPGELSPGQLLSIQQEEDLSAYAGVLQNGASPRDLQVSLPSWALERLGRVASKRGIREQDLALLLIVQQLETAPA